VFFCKVFALPKKFFKLTQCVYGLTVVKLTQLVRLSAHNLGVACFEVYASFGA
jgi:hypothetical protein